MSTTNSAANIKSDVKRKGQQVLFSPLMETLTRVGYAVRGLIYVTMGVLSAQVAFGNGGKLANPQDAIAAIGRQPAGLLLLWVVLIGLVSYSLWGIARAILDPLRKGHDLKGLVFRFGYLVSAFSYSIMIWPTYSYTRGAHRSAGGSSQAQKFTASLMAMPLGRWTIGILGLVVLIGGLYQIYLGFKPGFEQQFKTYTLNSDELKLVTNMGRFGTAARGAVQMIVGGLISVAAYQSNPNQPIGIDSALATLMHQPYGIWLLGIVALGLVAFGFYSILTGFWLRLKR
jgi:hypothetical protein